MSDLMLRFTYMDPLSLSQVQEHMLRMEGENENGGSLGEWKGLGLQQRSIAGMKSNVLPELFPPPGTFKLQQTL